MMAEDWHFTVLSPARLPLSNYIHQQMARRWPSKKEDTPPEQIAGKAILGTIHSPKGGCFEENNLSSRSMPHKWFCIHYGYLEHTPALQVWMSGLNGSLSNLLCKGG
ncbi:hypothetical protein DSO57_1035297 [Entomophthora muscae]|uniref:Uncharacterized protein n=1 Tax=Entomophthora muscae TaxID=34485 RepID=A0ACC2TAP3_9FUNG|nr:hypothetical protein DSO57_1035297 [Entomophthora muscae]